MPSAWKLCGYGWKLFALVWLIAALTTKRTEREYRFGLLPYIGLLIPGFYFLFYPATLPWPLDAELYPEAETANVIAVALTWLGIAIAFWARFYIGRNWSGTITLKRDHELVRGGPYALVRHPIYSGLLLAALGTAIASRRLAPFVAVPILVAAWKQKSLAEEALMTEQFGDQYRQYRRGVKGLIPYLW